MQDTHETPTVFRRWPDYTHVVYQTKPAKPREYQSLKAELESLGYNIKVIQKANRDKMTKAWHELHTNVY